MSEQEKKAADDSAIVDAKNLKSPERAQLDPLEKEERAAAMKNSKPAPAGAYIVTATKLKIDKKTYKKGDVFEGKLYPDLLSSKAIVPKEEWANRP